MVGKNEFFENFERHNEFSLLIWSSASDKAMWRGHLLPRDHNLSNLARGLLGDATCHIINVWVLRTETKIFKDFPM